MAGGRGELAFYLQYVHGVPTTVVDPRPSKMSRKQYRMLTSGSQPVPLASGRQDASVEAASGQPQGISDASTNHAELGHAPSPHRVVLDDRTGFPGSGDPRGTGGTHGVLRQVTDCAPGSRWSEREGVGAWDCDIFEQGEGQRDRGRSNRFSIPFSWGEGEREWTQRGEDSRDRQGSSRDQRASGELVREGSSAEGTRSRGLSESWREEGGGSGGSKELRPTEREETAAEERSREAGAPFACSSRAVETGAPAQTDPGIEHCSEGEGNVQTNRTWGVDCRAAGVPNHVEAEFKQELWDSPDAGHVRACSLVVGLHPDQVPLLLTPPSLSRCLAQPTSTGSNIAHVSVVYSSPRAPYSILKAGAGCFLQDAQVLVVLASRV